MVYGSSRQAGRQACRCARLSKHSVAPKTDEEFGSDVTVLARNQRNERLTGGWTTVCIVTIIV